MNITTIRKTALAKVQSFLPQYKILPFQYDLELNDNVSLERGIAVQLEQGNQQYDSGDNALFMDQILKVVLVRGLDSALDDNNCVMTLDDLYDAVPKIMRSFCMEKIGIPAIIQRAELSKLSEPQFLGDKRDNMKIELSFNLRYIVA